ncbi:MAG: hypothetical protein ACD_23C00428G0001 [uncultured bacterium]|nr:MAG: hypothetical protein ACD_23C00428G0001 [uncultured bacterium]
MSSAVFSLRMALSNIAACTSRAHQRSPCVITWYCITVDAARKSSRSTAQPAMPASSLDSCHNSSTSA